MLKLVDKKGNVLFESERAVTVVMPNGEEFSLSEKFGELIVNKHERSLTLFPSCSNEVRLK